METHLKNIGLCCISNSEAVNVFGGVDKKAQDALYTIGYVLGLIVSYVLAIFGIAKKINQIKM